MSNLILDIISKVDYVDLAQILSREVVIDHKLFLSNLKNSQVVDNQEQKEAIKEAQQSIEKAIEDATSIVNYYAAPQSIKDVCIVDIAIYRIYQARQLNEEVIARYENALALLAKYKKSTSSYGDEDDQSADESSNENIIKVEVSSRNG